MQPQLDHLLTRYTEHQQALASQPTPEQAFTSAQFQSVVAAMQEAFSSLQKFMVHLSPDVSVTNFPAYPTEMKTPDVKEVTKAVKALEKTLKPSKQDNADIVKAVQAVQAAISKLELQPVYKPEITVSPTPVTVTAPKVAAPKVTVQPTPVTVQATDVTSLVNATDKVTRTIESLKFPTTNVPTDPLIKYQPADIDEASLVSYYGYTDNAGAWYIRKVDASGNNGTKSIRFSMGQSKYTTNWTNRANLTYTLWGS